MLKKSAFAVSAMMAASICAPILSNKSWIVIHCWMYETVDRDEPCLSK